MTLLEFIPCVERAVDAVEWSFARSRRQHALADEREAIDKALPLAGRYGVERDPLEQRLAQITEEIAQDVTADCVPQLPLRSVPMDLIAMAVIRRILRLPADFPILSLKMVPSDEAIQDAVRAIAMNWQTPFGQTVDAA